MIFFASINCNCLPLGLLTAIGQSKTFEGTTFGSANV